MEAILAWDGLIHVINVAYFVAAFLFILGLKRMSSPKTARVGILWAGAGMVVATLVTFVHPALEDKVTQTNYILMLLAIAIGGIPAWVSGRKVPMTDMPQMVALYNGMGGGAAACIAAIELYSGEDHGRTIMTLAVLGGIIGSVAFSGSLIAYAKLQGIMKKTWRFPGQNILNMALMLGIAIAGVQVVLASGDAVMTMITGFFVLALILGITITVPIGGADMPVVISLYNALTGLAVAFEGFVIDNAAMIIAGTVVGAAGTMLTQLMANAMNRPLSNVLFGAFGSAEEGVAGEEGGTMKEIQASDAGVMMAYAEKVIVVPGYGMAVAQAQHKVWEMCQMLIEKGVDVKFAIHPVAGRMPGHMNVLLAEAGVPYDRIYDLDEINSEFEKADVALIIGANDVVNPVARTNPDSPIYGMPILNADKAKNVIVVKRGQGTGFSGIQNALFTLDNTQMLYGDGQKVANDLIQTIKEY